MISITLDREAGALAALHCRYFAARLVPFFLILAAAFGSFCYWGLRMPAELAISGAVFALLAWSVAYYFRMKRTYAKRLKDPITYQIGEEAVMATTRGIESKIEWPRFTRVREMAGFWLLFYTDTEYVAVPREKLGGQATALLEMLRAKGVAGAENLS